MLAISTKQCFRVFPFTRNTEGLANRVVWLASRAALLMARRRTVVFGKGTLTVSFGHVPIATIKSKCMDHFVRNHMLRPLNTYGALLLLPLAATGVPVYGEGNVKAAADAMLVSKRDRYSSCL